MDKELINKYNSILRRSFNYDLELFLFQAFLNGYSDEDLLANYYLFAPSKSLTQQYLNARQLSKDSDIIERTDIQVKKIDELFKQWFEVNQKRLKEFENAYRNNRFLRLEDFISFCEENDKKCHYCEITELRIEDLIKSGNIHTKRLGLRGRFLEIDRKDANGKYGKENIVFCCYWCNNAKTDEFTSDEFLNVGKQIKEIWKKRF